MTKVVIFGKGKVGIATDLTLKINADFHDPLKGCVVTNFDRYDKAIICVSSLVDGPHDHKSILECLNTLNDANFYGTIAIRCTVHPLALRMWEVMFPKLSIIHFPEFMKQSDDSHMDTPWILVLGGDRRLTTPFGIWLVDSGYGHEEQWHLCTLEESALIKLHQNAGLALKVVFANIMQNVCQQYGADYNTVRTGVAADVRVGPHHMQVPGEHGYGFGGHCLPKDVTCLSTVGDDLGLWDNILQINKRLTSKNG